MVKTRMRRLREHSALRRLVQENELSKNDLVHPLFVHHGNGIKAPITSMPGHYQLSIDNLRKEVGNILKLDIPAIILFGIPEKKDSLGSDSYSKDGIVQKTIYEIKNIAPELLVISDLCFCQYTDHGHCGILKDGKIDNDLSLEFLAKQAISHAEAGADVLAPSCMMDGMVAAIRKALGANSFEHLSILSYSSKYASSFYGPFREAAQGTPKFGDRKTYQMNIANSDEAIREAALDVNEGADMLMVKPASNYLDVIYRMKQAFPAVPVAAYQVSGEYAMIKTAAERGFIDEKQAVIESLLSIKRAGASFVINYFCKDVARWIK